MKKFALVTGSSRGIGLGILKMLNQAGFFTIMSSTGYTEHVKSEMEKLENCDYIPCDIAESNARKSLFETIAERYNRLDVLVNNAGVAPAERADILQTTEESYDRVVDTNQKGTFFISQLAANHMIAALSQGFGDYHPRIINISSLSSYTSSVNRSEYCISKSGISMMTKLFADRLSAYSIPVFEISPGIIDTDMTASDAVHQKYDKLMEDGLLPTARWGTPEDIAKAVTVLCSGMLDYSTGQVLHVDGGFQLRRL